MRQKQGRHSMSNTNSCGKFNTYRDLLKVSSSYFGLYLGLSLLLHAGFPLRWPAIKICSLIYVFNRKGGIVA